MRVIVHANTRVYVHPTHPSLSPMNAREMIRRITRSCSLHHATNEVNNVIVRFGIVASFLPTHLDDSDNYLKTAHAKRRA